MTTDYYEYALIKSCKISGYVKCVKIPGDKVTVLHCPEDFFKYDFQMSEFLLYILSIESQNTVILSALAYSHSKLFLFTGPAVVQEMNDNMAKSSVELKKKYEDKSKAAGVSCTTL